jgi:hypothetical protein
VACHRRKGHLLFDVTVHFLGIGIEGPGDTADFVVCELIAEPNAALVRVDTRQLLAQLRGWSGQLAAQIVRYVKKRHDQYDPGNQKNFMQQTLPAFDLGNDIDSIIADRRNLIVEASTVELDIVINIFGKVDQVLLNGLRGRATAR